MLPNLNNEEAKAKNAPVVTFTYDNTSEDTDRAMRVFQKMFGSKRGWIMTAAYIVMMVAAGVLIAFNPRQPVLYLAVGLCVVFLTLTVSAPLRRRKKIIKRIESMPPEDYECELYSDKIVIKTFIREQDGVRVENPEPVVQLFPFRGEYLLDFDDNESAVVLFVNGSSFFCFPKRCLTEEQTTKLLEILGKSVSEID